MTSYHLPTLKLLLLCLLIAGALFASTAHAQTVPPDTTPGPVLPTDPNAPVTAPSEPLPAGAVRQVVRPGVETTVASSDGRIEVQIPRDALNFPGTIQLHPVSLSDLPPANGTFQFAGQAVEINIFDATGGMVLNPTFANPIQICFVASAPQTGNAHSVKFYDTTLQQWVSLPTAVDPVSGKVCGSVTHLTLFALTEEAAPANSGIVPVAQANPLAAIGIPGALPGTGDTASFILPWWGWMLAAFAIVCGAGLVLRSRRAHR